MYVTSMRGLVPNMSENYSSIIYLKSNILNIFSYEYRMMLIPKYLKYTGCFIFKNIWCHLVSLEAARLQLSPDAYIAVD